MSFGPPLSSGILLSPFLGPDRQSSFAAAELAGGCAGVPRIEVENC
ncbi:MAG: hypothetical protein ACXW3M_01245 [Rhodoplanes sp.]